MTKYIVIQSSISSSGQLKTREHDVMVQYREVLISQTPGGYVCGAHCFGDCNGEYL